jgi:adenylate cyclase
LVLVLALAGFFLWQQFSAPVPQLADSFPNDPVPLSQSDKPSIAVLPFDNMSGDADQSYFSDGISENLITDLSRISGLLVIARNTSFSFRDQPGEAEDIASELGVRYVVEGSVQRAGDHVRINAKLVDAGTGFQVWAGRLDRKFIDLFALQDEVTAQIIDALQVELTQEERQLKAKRHTNSLEAYDLYLRA